MRGRGISGATIGLGVALAVAAGAGAYLLSVKRTAERAVTPVEVAAPDLYPPQTLLFLAAHRFDEAWGTWETWWNRFEPTAAHAALRERWPERRRALPEKVRGALEDFERGLDEAEARFGHRPTTREFFETYGRYTAFGLLPDPAGGRPRVLAVVRLPGEGAEAMLRNRLGTHGAVRPHEPPQLNGYPVFEEDAGPLGRTYYGIGGGYLFLADDASVLEVSLGRLASLSSGEWPGGAAGPPCLSNDPVFARAGAEPWDRVRLALFVRKGQEFAKWKPEWEALDDYLAHAFVLAPGDPAIAGVALAPEGGAGPWRIRSSWAKERPGGRKWEEVLPAGLASARIQRSVDAARMREFHREELEAFRGKAIWKEIDAFVRDADGLRLFLREALGEDSVPPDETLRRLPHDLDFVAALFDAVAEGLLFAPENTWCWGQKVYRTGGKASVQSALAVEIDPLSTAILAAAFDTAVDRSEGVVVRREAAGVHSWAVDPEGVRRRFLDRPGLEEVREAVSAQLELWCPAFTFADGALFVTIGEDMGNEVRALLGGGGGPSLASDPLFVEAVAAVEPGAAALDFGRPAEMTEGQWDQARGQLEEMLEKADTPGDALEVMLAGFAAVDEGLSWMKRIRASVTAHYLDPARPSVSVLLLDPGAETGLPPLPADPAGLRAPGVLPEGTFFLVEGRVAVRPAVERLVAAFLEALPGGRERWDEVRAELEVDEDQIEVPLDRLLVDIRGETGMAVAIPPVGPMPEGPPDPQALLDRVPAGILFAQYADPDAAFDEAAKLLETIQEMLDDPVPFEVRKSRFDRGRGPQPIGVKFAVTEIAGIPVAALSVFVPPGPRQEPVTAEMGVVRRGDLLLFTLSSHALSAMARAEPGGPGTLGARTAALLPPGTLPEGATGLFLVSEDGLADWLAGIVRPLAPLGASFTLQGYGRRQPPPQERVEAHEKGWKRGVDLFLDLFRTGKWRASATVEEGEKLRTVTVRVSGR